MDAFQKLLVEAREKRDRELKRVQADYQATVLAISELSRKLTGKATGAMPRRCRRIRRTSERPFNAIKASEAAERVLLERGPLTLVELTLEVQGRGCRAGDDPRSVANSIRGAFYYHTSRFRCVDGNRWTVQA